MNVFDVSVSVLTLMTLITAGWALNCYQCNSTLDHDCQRKFNHNNRNSPLKETMCKMYQAKYCIKATGMWGGAVGTHRFCSSKDMGDQCQDMYFPDHNRFYRGCVYTCAADGCNGGSTIYTWRSTVLTLILSLVAILH